MNVAAEAGGDWAKFKAEMQRRFKLGDGLLTKTNLEMLESDEFSTVGAFATAFEKIAKKVPGLAEEEQCTTLLWHFKNWEASSLTKKAVPGNKLTWAAIKEGVIEGELDQVDIFQMRQAKKKRKALDATTSDGRDFKKMIKDAVAQLDAEKEDKRKTMAAPQTQGKAKKAVVQEEEEEEEEEPEPSKHATFPIESFLKIWRRQDLETELTFEELLDLRARQIGVIEDRIEEAASKTEDSRTKDKFRWDKMARVRKEPLKEDQPMTEARPEEPHESPRQEMDEDQAAKEKEFERQERSAREQEIRAEIRRKNLEELHKRTEQGERPVNLKDRKGKSVSSQQEEDPPLLSEAWENFDKLMETAKGPGAHQQEMGVKLVFADLLTLKGVMKDGFAAAKASDQKVGERLTKVARKAYGQGVEWEREIKDLKESQERQDRELDAMKVELEKAWAGNEAIRLVNQTLSKGNDVLRAYLQTQQTSFQAKEAEWEKRIKELETKVEQRTPTTLVDWTEVQGFEMKRLPAEDTFKSHRVEEKADLQEGEDVPLLDKEMLQPEEVSAKEEANGEESEWQMPSIVALQRAHEGLGAAQQAETARDERMLPIAQEVVEEQVVKRVEVEAEQGAGLEEALGSWATGSGSEARVSGPVIQEGDRVVCPIPSETPQQEVTSEITTVLPSIPSQEEEKTIQKKTGKCFYCKRGEHRVDDCPKSLKDEAAGLGTRESSGKWIDKNGLQVHKGRDV
ncbi:hypothetical protein CBR_g8974, partial [Chara braunii]